MKTKKYDLIGRKGVGPIAIAIVIAAGLLVFEGVVVSNFVANSEVIKRSARELGVIDAINIVELTKKYIQNAVSYSFYKASYDVLQMGGFCSSESECPTECKMPDYVPSKECKPFWLVYDDIYATPYDTTDATGGFKEYAINRTQFIFTRYSKSSIGPSYCPPDGEATISESDYLLELRNVKNGVIEYVNNNIRITERTTNFTEIIDTSPLELFKYARSTFVENDKIGSDFSDINTELGEDEYCGDRTGSRGFGDVCENEGGPSICETWLQNNCYQYNVGNDPCDFDEDGTIDADEKYRCMVEERLEQTLLSSDSKFMSTVSLDDCTRSEDTSRVDCIKVGHTYEPIYNEIAVDWDEYKLGGALAECNVLLSCGCADECEIGEGCQLLQCNPDGSCPSQAEIDAACTDKVNNCGYYTSCAQGCQEYECSYSDSNPCEVVVGCEGDCYLDGCECVPTQPIECYYYGQCYCNPVVEERYDCEHECCQDGLTCSRMGCVFNWGCNENTCGLSCCQRMNSLYQDLECDYHYFGTASALVKVEDVKIMYPIGSSWQSLQTSFYIVSGNDNQCNDIEPIERSEYVEEEDDIICSPAIVTNNQDLASGCKLISEVS